MKLRIKPLVGRIAAMFLGPCVLAAAFPSGYFAITHVRVFDGEHTLPDQTVVVQGGKIAAVGPDATIPAGMTEIPGVGRTLLPGLIDAHVHAYPANALRDAETLGVTTVLDMFNSPALVARDKAAESSGAGLDSADILSAGYLATAPAGHGTEYGIEVPTITSPDEAQSWVDARIAEGSDYIKIILEDGSAYGRSIPTLDAPTIKALVAAAHRRHKMAVFHIGTYAEAREAIDAGADGLMHLFIDRVPDPGFGAYVAARHVFVVPTLSVLLSLATANDEGKSLAADERLAAFLPPQDVANLQQPLSAMFASSKPLHYEATTEAIRQLKAAHALILAGTDAPNIGTMFGASLHGELELLVKAGLTPAEALSAATAKPAACFHLSDRGRIAPGERADLLLVTGDPTVNITDTRNIVAVWKAGHAAERVSYIAAPDGNKKMSTAGRLICGFDDGSARCSFGLGWSESTDTIYGGKSTGDFKVVPGGANGTAKSLRISGKIDGGLPYAWAGAMFTPGARPFLAVDLSKSKGLEFWARGDSKTYRLMIFTQTTGPVPQVMTFEAGPEWKHYSFPFAAFGGGNGHDIEAILFCGGPQPGSFAFQIDQVGLVGK